HQIAHGCQRGPLFSRHRLIKCQSKYLLSHFAQSFCLPPRRFRPAALRSSSAVTTRKRIKFVEPEAICVPATTPSTLPLFTLPRRSNSCSAADSICSAVSEYPLRTGCTPHNKFMRLQTAGVWLKA